MTSLYTVQTNFRGRNDGVTLNSATFTHALNANWTQITDTNFRLRLEVEEQNGRNASVGNLEYNLAGGGWNQVTTTSSVVKLVATSQYTHGDPTTNIISGSAKAFAAGDGCSDGTIVTTNLNNTHTEYEYCLQIIGTDVAHGQTLQLRMSGLNAWTNTPTITVSEPALVILNTAVLTALGRVLVVDAPIPSTTINLSTAVSSLTGQVVTVSAPAAGVEVQLAVGTLTASGQPLSVVEGPVSIALATPSLALTGQSTTVIPGATTISLATATATLLGRTSAISMATPQLVYPISDISVGGWTPSSGAVLWDMLDEPTPSDADYIESSDNPTADLCEVRMDFVTDPQSSSNYRLRHRVEKEGPATGSITFYLMEGTTQRDTWTVNDVPDSPTTYTREFSQAVIDSIVDHSNLRVRMEATVSQP